MSGIHFTSIFIILSVGASIHFASCLYDNAIWNGQDILEGHDTETDAGSVNPNLQAFCPPKNDPTATMNNRFCKNGGYIYNPDPYNCGSLYKCYLDEGEICEQDLECLNAMVCSCGRCRRHRELWCRDTLANLLKKIENTK